MSILQTLLDGEQQQFKPDSLTPMQKMILRLPGLSLNAGH
jgi:hypothetical protein